MFLFFQERYFPKKKAKQLPQTNITLYVFLYKYRQYSQSMRERDCFAKVSIWSISLCMKDTSKNHFYKIIEQVYTENPTERTLDLTLPCREIPFYLNFKSRYF